MWVRSEKGLVRPTEWVHIALVHDDKALTTTIFVNGNQVAQGVDFKAPNPSDGEIWLGNYWAKINGSIKDFRIWSKAFDVAEQNADITGAEADLQMWFPLNKVKGVEFKDETGNYDGEMRGISWNVEE